VQGQSQQDGKGKPGGEAVKANADCVSHDPIELVGVEELDEVFQADPGAAEYALCGYKIPERDLGSVHRNVFEDQYVEDGQKYDEVQLIVFPDPLQNRSL
jgi:hypothetical protein